jgi:hypothetical protein
MAFLSIAANAAHHVTRCRIQKLCLPSGHKDHVSTIPTVSLSFDALVTRCRIQELCIHNSKRPQSRHQASPTSSAGASCLNSAGSKRGPPLSSGASMAGIGTGRLAEEEASGCGWGHKNAGLWLNGRY